MKIKSKKNTLTVTTDLVSPRTPSPMPAKRSVPDQFLKAHSAALHVTHRGTLAQHRTWFFLVRNAVHDLSDPTVTKHKLPLGQLAVLLGQEDPNYGFLKKTVSGLTNLNISWDIFDKTGEPEWGVASMLAGCKISGGVIEYDFSSFLREKLANPKMYALLNLAILNQFRSKYALAIYELCKDYEGVGQTPVIPIDKYRAFQGLEETEYKEFKRLNTRVIKEPMEEVNKVSDIQVSVEYRKIKKMIVGIKFFVQRNPQVNIDIQDLMNTGAAVTDNKILFNNDSKSMLKQLISVYGLSAAQAKKIVSRHDVDYINGNLAVIDKDRKKNNVKNLVAYVMAAMRDDYRPKADVTADGPADTAQEQKRLNEMIEEYRSSIIKEHIKSLSSAARHSLEQEFLVSVKEDRVAEVLLRDGGLSHPVMKERFNLFAQSKLKERISIDKRDLAAFIKKRDL